MTAATLRLTATRRPTPDLILVANQVTKQFGGLIAVRDVDLAIPRGAIVSIIGPNGAGKTTFFNMIVGIIEPTSAASLSPVGG